MSALVTSVMLVWRDEHVQETRGVWIVLLRMTHAFTQLAYWYEHLCLESHSPGVKDRSNRSHDTSGNDAG